MDWRNRVGLYGSYFFGMAADRVTLPYLPLFLADKGLSDRSIGIISTLAALSGLAQFPVGLWSDRINWRKPFLIAALAVAAVSTVFLKGAENAVWLGFLVILFAENGISRAVVESLSGAEAAALAPKGEVGAALGALRFWKPIGIVLVALLGSWMAEEYGVGSILYPLMVSQFLAVAAAFLIHEPDGQSDAKDEHPRQAKADGDPEGRWLPRDPGLWAFVAAMILYHAANAPGGVYLGLFLKRDLHAPDRLLAYAFAVSMVAWMLVRLAGGQACRSLGRKPLLIAGWTIMAIRLGLVSVIQSPGMAVANQALDGLGNGLFAVLAASWMTDRLDDPRRSGEAQVIVGTCLVLGSAIGPAIAGFVVGPLGYRGLFAALAGVGLVATAIVVFLVPETLSTHQEVDAEGEVEPMSPGGLNLGERGREPPVLLSPSTQGELEGVLRASAACGNPPRCPLCKGGSHSGQGLTPPARQSPDFLSRSYLERSSAVTTHHASMPLVSTIFGLTYLALAIGKIPGLRIDRSGIALVGAAAMLASGVLTMPEAARAVDYETIVLLFGMMVVVSYLRMAGFFDLATDRIAARFSGPFALLAVTIGLSGILSAFLVNDVVCVALTPLVLHLCQRLKRPPIPYLVGLATASNVGSVATITGNPQNIIIGSLSHISYLRFAARLAPIAAICLVINFAVVALVYRKALNEKGAEPDGSGEGDGPSQPRVHRGLLIKSIAVTLVTVGLFFAGQPIALVALVAAAVLMLGRVRPEKVYESIDWPLLVMFTGLFVVVHAFEANVVQTWGLDRQKALLDSPVVLVSGLSVMLSNLVSNVPAVLLFKPLMEVMPRKELAWLALSMSSTLAGNLTVLGSVANLIVVENARRAGTELGFLEYLKVGVPLTILTTLVGVAWLQFVHY